MAGTDNELFETALPVVVVDPDETRPPELFKRPLPVVVIGEPEFPTTGVIDGGSP